MLIRKSFRITNGLALCCMMIALCAAPITAAQVEGVEGGQGAVRAPAAKKKITFAQFDVVNTLHVDDINNIYDGFPLALAGRLAASGEFLTAYTGRSIPLEAGEAQREAVVQIAAECGAQFFISGVVVNAGTRQERGYLGTPIGGGTKRHIEVELAVYDGLTGNRLLQRRFAEQAEGEVRVGNDKPFGSSIFLATEFGQAVNRLLDAAAGDIRAALEKAPFSANIIKAEARKVFLDAGSDARLKPGDQLVIFVRDASPVVGLKGAVLGATDRAADIVTLTEVQPQFSIGELAEEAAKQGIRAGSIARIDPAEQRNVMARQLAAQRAARAEQEARAEAERQAKEQAAQAEAARVKSAEAEAARIKAEKEARARAAAEAKAAKLKAAQEARVRRLSAAQEAREREKAQAARAAARAKREAARAEAARIKEEKKAAAEAKKQADAEAKAEAARIKAEKEAQAKAEKEAKAKAAAEDKAEVTPKPAKEKTTPKNPPGMEVRAVAIEDLQREAAEAKKAKAERLKAEKEAQATAGNETKAKERIAASGVQPVTEIGTAKAEPLVEAEESAEKKKQGVPLKLKQIKP